MSLLPETEYKRLCKITYNGLVNGDDLLTEFDRGFLKDYDEKFTKYKRHTFVSDKQHEQFDRIENYLKEGLGHDYED